MCLTPRHFRTTTSDSGRATIPAGACDELLPVRVADYVDFYASLEHVENFGRLWRPGQPAVHENWRRLPETLASANRIELEVKWSEKAGSKRVVTDEDPEMAVGGETFTLPYHVCLSELLYGEPLYRQRRVMWGLPLSGGTTAKAPAPDRGGTRDAGAASGPADATSSQ